MKIKSNQMKTNSFIFCIIIFCLFISCASSRKYSLDNLNGIYSNESDQGLKLILSRNSFLHIREEQESDLALYKCCDTISFGKVEYINKPSFLVLTSLRDIDEYLNFTVQEYQELDQDSIKFIFTNPIENHYNHFNENYRELFYSIEVLNADFQNVVSDKNPVTINSEKEIKEFQIKIYPKYDIPLSRLEVMQVKLRPYKVINNKSNIFKINIPQLNYEYLSYKRLTGDYVKVVNDKKLIWDGKIYVKTSTNSNGQK